MDVAIRKALTLTGTIPDSLPFAEEHGFSHADIIGVCKSLASGSFISTQHLTRTAIQLTKEGHQVATLGSPEARVFALVPAQSGILQDMLAAAAGSDLAKVGMAKAVQMSWLQVIKEEAPPEEEVAPGSQDAGKKKPPSTPKRLVRLVDRIEDRVQAQLKAVLAGGGVETTLTEEDYVALKKRGLLVKATLKSVAIRAGDRFGTWGAKSVTDLSHEMLVKGTWRDTTYKPLNFFGTGKPPSGGALHPLMKVRSMFREIFLEMGFQEMHTNKYVESSFWNFDALYQPQQHLCR